MSAQNAPATARTRAPPPTIDASRIFFIKPSESGYGLSYSEMTRECPSWLILSEGGIHEHEPLPWARGLGIRLREYYFASS